jgi:hypothetical protein
LIKNTATLCGKRLVTAIFAYGQNAIILQKLIQEHTAFMRPAGMDGGNLVINPVGGAVRVAVARVLLLQ